MRVALFIITIAFITPSYSQDVKQQINSIKKDSKYINAEATEDSREGAFSMALEELVSEVNSLYVSNVSPKELKGITKSLELKRGESMRVFVYVLKEDVKTLTVSKPIPAKIDTVTTKRDSIINMQVSQAHHTNQNDSAIVSSQLTPLHSTIDGGAQLGKITSVFSRMNTFTEIKSLLRQYKKEGKLSDFNWVSTRNVSPDASVIIFREEKIVAILLQEKNGRRINYLTNKEDNISNYSGCRAIWYKE